MENPHARSRVTHETCQALSSHCRLSAANAAPASCARSGLHPHSQLSLQLNIVGINRRIKGKKSAEHVHIVR
ncbi:hypothetical protein J6590_046537 [Homalodisca vitripennis]|nr:hypothetical protein J6590_046537 [Homalodisca vitripennis]